VLGNAGHLQQGATLIENLVGIAERQMVEKEARWALRRNVFTSPEEIEAALHTLQAYDVSNPGPDRWVRGEHAMMMDTMQHLFEPAEPGGEPEFRADRAERLFGSDYHAMLETEDGEVRLPTADDARTAVDLADGHYRELREAWQVGYPDVRQADVNAVQEKWLSGNPAMKCLLPSLARAYKLQARVEASRRATQLAYGVELFNARNGRWPASLDELPADYGAQMKIDPFTGSNFGYRLAPDGPTIYSLSENGIDDGGIHSPRWDDMDTTETGSDDHVFWPPQQ